MRNCPEWFQRELTRIGGTNPYGEPVFKLVWSTEPKRTIGGRFPDGYIGYRRFPEIHSAPCWALMVWESREVAGGSPLRWEMDFRDEETGMMDVGGYPKHGAYRCLTKFIHYEVTKKWKEEIWYDGPLIRKEMIQVPYMEVYRMEPCGFILDVMLPMLMMWRKLSGKQKVEALRQEERLKEQQVLKMAKDVMKGCKVNRGSALIAKRAEIIEKGMAQAMKVAAQYGLGTVIGGHV